MALTKAAEAIGDNWIAVAQNTIVESGTLDCTGHYQTLLHIQAFLDDTTAHTGTRFRPQISSNTSGDEDWEDLMGVGFLALDATAATDLIEDNPLAAAATTIALTGHALTALGIWLAIEDGTLTNSELIFEKAQDTNSITIVDGTTRSHVQNTAIFNVAFSRVIVLPSPTLRARLLVDNTYDNNGATLNYKIRASKMTGI